VPACDDFTTFSNLLFDADDDFSSSDDMSFSDENIQKEIYSNPLFDKEIISIKIDLHHFNAESDLIESLLNQNSLIISSSSKIDSLLDEFTAIAITFDLPTREPEDSLIMGDEHLDTILETESNEFIKSSVENLVPNPTNCDPKEDIHLVERLLYDKSSPRPLEEFVSENSNANIEYFFPSPIPNEDSNSLMEEINLSYTLDDRMPSSIEDDDDDSERDILINEELLDNYSFSLSEN
nr:hypothetical protein [Tanacetum cinerariifolium]